jgi:hypothetical protein
MTSHHTHIQAQAISQVVRKFYLVVRLLPPRIYLLMQVQDHDISVSCYDFHLLHCGVVAYDPEAARDGAPPSFPAAQGSNGVSGFASVAVAPLAMLAVSLVGGQPSRTNTVALPLRALPVLRIGCHAINL